ncbi:preprotein translocase subunit Tim44 [Rubrivivax gelatinosus]|nr:preprotein translocase subunit Tim44 [Rubrivivax gelatinosus]
MLSRLARLKRRVSPLRHASKGAAACGADVEDFLRVARASFVTLQAAWDAADLGAIAAITTEDLLAELREQLEARGPGPNRTEVLSLQARLLGLDEVGQGLVASVEFSGWIRERMDDGAAPFRELWLLANLKSAGRGWQIARVQALS